MWQQVDDPAAFDTPDSRAGKGSPPELNQPPSLDSEMMDALSLHKTNVDDNLSHQLSTNGLVDAHTMLDTEDRQDIWLDTEESLEFQEEDSTMDNSFLTTVDDEDELLQFTDRLRGQNTSQESLSLQLLKLLCAIGAPNYAYSSIMDIFSGTAAARVVTIGSTFRQRDTAIKHFANRFCLNKLFPTTLTKHMNGRSYPVVLHDAEVMVTLLLKSSLMVEENMLFPDMSDPLAPPPPTVDTIADVDTGSVFCSTYHELCTKPNDVLCPLIMYLDRISIDQHGRCSLEPGYATLGIWNLSTRNKAEA